MRLRFPIASCFKNCRRCSECTQIHIGAPGSCDGDGQPGLPYLHAWKRLSDHVNLNAATVIRRLGNTSAVHRDDQRLDAAAESYRLSGASAGTYSLKTVVSDNDCASTTSTSNSRMSPAPAPNRLKTVRPGSKVEPGRSYVYGTLRVKHARDLRRSDAWSPPVTIEPFGLPRYAL
jgi:hypothetical protein